MHGVTKENIIRFMARMHRDYSHLIPKDSVSAKYIPAIYFNLMDIHSMMTCMTDLFDPSCSPKISELRNYGTLFGSMMLFSEFIPEGFCFPADGYLLLDQLVTAQLVPVNFYCPECDYTDWGDAPIHRKADCELYKVETIMTL